MAEIRTTSSTGGQKGVKLARFDLIPAGPLKELAEHYGRGARKYANHQWRQGYEWSKSIGALGRHFNDFMAGKDYDVCENDPTGCSFVDADGNPFEGEVTPNGSTCFNHTGSHHMAAVAWHAFLLLEFKDSHPAHDDRYKAPEPEPEYAWGYLNPETGSTSDIPMGLGDLTHEMDEAITLLASIAAVPTVFIVDTDGEIERSQAFGPDLLSKRRPRI